jgi:hypothetical protein
MLELAGELRAIDPGAIGRHQIDARATTIAGNAVLVPDLDSPRTQAVLGWFRGDAESPAVPATATAGSVADGGAGPDIPAQPAVVCD